MGDCRHPLIVVPPADGVVLIEVTLRWRGVGTGRMATVLPSSEEEYVAECVVAALALRSRFSSMLVSRDFLNINWDVNKLFYLL